MSDEQSVKSRLEELLLQYTYYYGMRKSRKDKQQCYAFISKMYQEAGFPVTFGKLSAGITRMGYCVAGDLKKADRVFIAPFNTKDKTFFRGYRFYPFLEKRTSVYNGLAAAANILVGIATAIFCGSVVGYLSGRIWPGVLVGLAAYYVLLFAMGGIFNFSPSAPLALMHYLALHCKKPGKYAFVFLDRAVDDYMPLKLFLVKHKAELGQSCTGKSKQIFYLSNLAHSEKLMFATSKPLTEAAQLAEASGGSEITLSEKDLPKCFANAPNMIFVTAVDIDRKGQYYVGDLRCKADKTMDVKRLKRLAETFLAEN